jgi:hypothetical protein
LPADTEEEDDPSIPPSEVITQTDEFGADEEHLPSFGTTAVVYGFNEEEAREIEEERERSISQFAHDMLGNLSAPESEDENYGDTGNTTVISSKVTVVDVGSERPEPPQEHGFSLQIGYAGPVDMLESVAPSHWSSTWAQSRAEAEQRRANEIRFSWMRDADLQMLSMGLEPVPWEEFAEAIRQTEEDQFQAIEQRTCKWMNHQARTLWLARHCLFVQRR